MPRNHLTITLLSGVAAIALLPFTAMAQDQTPATPKVDSAGITEVIVTAQRRAESAQKASVSIDVLSSDQLRKAGVSQAIDIAKIAPGVQITQGGTATQIYIRGAGTFSTTPLMDPAVSLNLDGVYIARSQALSGTFFDLSRVEVLKGPQGTLYGRNSSGGALNLITTAPRLGYTSGYIQAGIQNYNGKNLEGALNLPLGDKLAMRAAFQVVDRDGYISDGSDDDKHESARLQFLYKPNDDVSLRLWTSYQHMGGKGAGYVINVPNATALGGVYVPKDRWTSVIPELNRRLAIFNTGKPVIGGLPFAKPLDASLIQQDIKAWNVHAQAAFNLGFGTLTIIPAYQKTTVAAQSFPGLSYSTVSVLTGLPQISEATSLEARISDNDGQRFKWTAGGFYFKEDQTNSSTVDLGTVASNAYAAELGTESTALFGQASYEIIPKLRLIGGLRYTDETRTIKDGLQYALYPSAACTTAGTGPLGSCLLFTVNSEFNDSRINYRAGVEYQVAPQNMLFATVSTGFKSGGQTVGNVPPYLPETIEAYTIGSKNRFLQNRLQVNLEAFYWKYDNRQENMSRPDANGTLTSTIINAGSSVSKGLSLDTIVRPTPRDEFHLGVEWNVARYDDFRYTAYRNSSNGCTPYPGTAPYTIDCSGYQLSRSPLWSGSASYSHTFTLGNAGKLETQIDTTFASSRWIQASFVSNARAPGYSLINLGATYSPVSETYSVDFFVRNLTEEAVYTGGDQHPFDAGLIAMSIGAPRTYGVRVRYDF